MFQFVVCAPREFHQLMSAPRVMCSKVFRIPFPGCSLRARRKAHRHLLRRWIRRMRRRRSAHRKRKCRSIVQAFGAMAVNHAHRLSQIVRVVGESHVFRGARCGWIGNEHHDKIHELSCGSREAAEHFRDWIKKFRRTAFSDQPDEVGKSLLQLLNGRHNRRPF